MIKNEWESLNSTKYWHLYIVFMLPCDDAMHENIFVNKTPFTVAWTQFRAANGRCVLVERCQLGVVGSDCGSTFTLLWNNLIIIIIIIIFYFRCLWMSIRANRSKWARSLGRHVIARDIRLLFSWALRECQKPTMNVDCVSKPFIASAFVSYFFLFRFHIHILPFFIVLRLFLWNANK